MHGDARASQGSTTQQSRCSASETRGGLVPVAVRGRTDGRTFGPKESGLVDRLKLGREEAVSSCGTGDKMIQ